MVGSEMDYFMNNTHWRQLLNFTEELFPDFFEGLEHNYTRISPVFITNRVQLIAGVYAILFLVGLCGNTSVLSIIFYIHGVIKEAPKSKEQSMMIFIVALCLVDSMVILSLPMTISNLLMGHWMFGEFLCKCYWMVESAGKIMSTFVLTALSFYRFVGTCHPSRARSIVSPNIILPILCSAALLLLIPLPYSAETLTTILSEPVFSGMGLRFFGTKCTVGYMNKTLFFIFTTYIFALGYCIPLVLLIFFYSRVLHKLRGHKKTIKLSRIPLKRITAYTVLLVAFYFTCYTPYWLGTLISIIAPGFVQTRAHVYTMYFIHALPYVNSSLNFVFYAMLNAELRRTITESRPASRISISRRKPHSNIFNDGSSPSNSVNFSTSVLNADSIFRNRSISESGNGLLTLKKLRKPSKKRRLIIACAANSSDSDVRNGLRNGLMTDYLQKHSGSAGRHSSSAGAGVDENISEHSESIDL